MTNDRNLTDRQIIDRVLTGDTQAFNILIHRYTAPMSRYALTVIRNDHMAQEAVEEAFVECFLHLPSLKNPDLFEGWLAVTIKRKCFRFGKQRQCEDIFDYAELLTSEEKTPEEYIIFSEERQKVREAVKQLPEKLQEVIVLHYFEDCQICDIAKKLGIPSGSVKRRLFDAREKLKKELKNMVEMTTSTEELEQRIIEKIAAVEQYHALNPNENLRARIEDIQQLIDRLPDTAPKKYYNAETLRLEMLGVSGEEYDRINQELTEAAERNEHPESLASSLIDSAYKIFMGDDVNLKRVAFLKEKALPRIEKCKGMPGYETAKAEILMIMGKFCAESESGDLQAALSFYREGRALLPDDSFYAIALDNAITTLTSAQNHCAFPEMGVVASTVQFTVENGNCAAVKAATEVVNRVSKMQLPAFLYCTWDGSWTCFSENGQISENSDDCTTLQTVSASETVCLPAGNFENCRHFRLCTREQPQPRDIWYKEGVGIVKILFREEDCNEIQYELSEYTLTEKKTGLLPFSCGNSWTYTNPKIAGKLINYVKLEVKQVSKDGKTAVITEESLCNLPKNCLTSPEFGNTEIYMAICDKLCEKWQLEDALSYLRAAIRANTSKSLSAFALASAESMKRFADYRKKNYRFLPSGISLLTYKKTGGNISEGDFAFTFGPSRYGSRGKYEDRIFGAKPERYLEWLTKGLYSEKWKPGYHEELSGIFYWNRELQKGELVTGTLDVTEGGTVITPAGCFENCIKLTLQAELEGKGENYYLDWNDGYSGQEFGKKEYWFAPDVGIVKFVCTWGNLISSELLLTNYRNPACGTGEYFPFYIGTEWEYEETHLKEEGYRAARLIKVIDGINDTFNVLSAQEFVFLGTEEEYKQKFFG